MGRWGTRVAKVEGSEDQVCKVTRRVNAVPDEVADEPQGTHRFARRKGFRGCLLPLGGPDGASGGGGGAWLGGAAAAGGEEGGRAVGGGASKGKPSTVRPRGSVEVINIFPLS